MAKLFTINFKSREKEAHVIEIYDITTSTDTTDEITIAEAPAQAASWAWNGKTKDIFQGVIPRSFTFVINVPGPGIIQDFVDDLIAETDEHRFWMKATKSGFEQFRGWIQVDQSTIPIRHQPDYPFTIRATDSLGQSSNYDYIDPATPSTPYEGTESVKDHLIKCLKAMDIDEIYGSSDEMLHISPVYHNALMPNTTDDYTARTYFDHRIFADTVEEQFKEINFIFGNISIPLGEKPTKPGNVRKVLDMLCFQYNAIFFHSRGKYHFIQRAGLLPTPNITKFRYDKTGALISSGLEKRQINVGSLQVNDTGVYQLGGTYSFLPPIKELIIDHQKGGGNNKIVGTEWVVTSHAERCFDQINNSGNAKVNARFVLKVAIKHDSNNDKGIFRFTFGIKIKIGTNYLTRDPNPSDVYSNDLENPFPGTTIEYDDPTWETSTGYYKVVVDRRATTIYDFGEDSVEIVDIESPNIPASGVLCVDVDLIEVRKFDTFTILGDDKWDPVTFDDADTISRSGKTWDIFWSATDNYLNITSDDGELNEDTLAYTRFTAQVNARNSQRLEFETRLGDDPGSNTHGRVQIDASTAGDGSDLQDADGGWTLYGTGTVYNHMVNLLAFDMARMRVGTLRVMTCELRTGDTPIEPHSYVIYDGKNHLMSRMSGNTADNNKGEWISLENPDDSAVSVINALFSKATESNPNIINITNGNSSGGGESGAINNNNRYIHDVTGQTLTRIAIPDSKPLPDSNVYTEAQINSMFRKALRGSGNMIYRTTPTHVTHFNIDNSTNEIVLFRAPSSSHEFFFDWET